MLKGDVEDMVTDAVICDNSYWIYSTKGGIVDVTVKLASRVEKGQVTAIIYDIYGREKEKVISDRSGVVIGKNIRPNCDAGTRLVHLGVDIIEAESEDIPGHDDFETP